MQTLNNYRGRVDRILVSRIEIQESRVTPRLSLVEPCESRVRTLLAPFIARTYKKRALSFNLGTIELFHIIVLRSIDKFLCR